MSTSETKEVIKNVNTAMRVVDRFRFEHFHEFNSNVNANKAQELICVRM